VDSINGPDPCGDTEEEVMAKKVSPIPDGMHTVTPTLTISGCAKAIDFYKKAFGAEEVDRAMAPDGKSVWHAALKIGDSVVFVNDEMPGMTSPSPGPGRPSPVRLWLYLRDCDASFKRAVDAGGKAKAQPEDMFWGDRCGMVNDPFGYEWVLASRVKEMTREEMRVAGEEFAKKMAGGR
jgi:PhnB protein